MINERHASEAASGIFRLIANYISPSQMNAYQKKYQEIVTGYLHSDFKISSSIMLDQYKPFQDWLPWLVAHKTEVIPILIHNMLERDIFAGKIYDSVQNAAGHSDLVLSYKILFTNKELDEAFIKLGAGHDSFVVLEAQNWLASEEATSITNEIDRATNSTQGHDTLCSVNEMLGVTNDFLTCD